MRHTTKKHRLQQTTFNTELVYTLSELKKLQESLADGTVIVIVDSDPDDISAFDVFQGSPYYAGTGPAYFPCLAVWVTR